MSATPPPEFRDLLGAIRTLAERDQAAVELATALAKTIDLLEALPGRVADALTVVLTRHRQLIAGDIEAAIRELAKRMDPTPPQS